MASVINQIKLGSVEYAIAASAYAECSTAAGTAAKVAAINTDGDTTNTAFTLIKGVAVNVKFTVTNTAASPTLNINSTGAKAIYYNGAAITAGYLKANKVYQFVYNGTQWDLVGDVEKNPNALTVKGNGTTSFSYDGSAAKTLNIKEGSNVSVSSDTSGNITIGVPAATGSVAGVTMVYPEQSCTTFSSDTGTVTPKAVQKGAKMFAITRPTKRSKTVTDNALVRWDGTASEVKDSKIYIQDVTNTKDTALTANVLCIPAEGGKKMVYGYCTDQTDGTSFIGGVFDAAATEFPYAEGLAIGGTSGNLLWKGAVVATMTDVNSAIATAITTALNTPV